MVEISNRAVHKNFMILPACQRQSIRGVFDTSTINSILSKVFTGQVRLYGLIVRISLWKGYKKSA